MSQIAQFNVTYTNLSFVNISMPFLSTSLTSIIIYNFTFDDHSFRFACLSNMCHLHVLLIVFDKLCYECFKC